MTDTINKLMNQIPLELREAMCVRALDMYKNEQAIIIQKYVRRFMLRYEVRWHESFLYDNIIYEIEDGEDNELGDYICLEGEDNIDFIHTDLKDKSIKLVVFNRNSYDEELMVRYENNMPQKIIHAVSECDDTIITPVKFLVILKMPKWKGYYYRKLREGEKVINGDRGVKMCKRIFNKINNYNYILVNVMPSQRSELFKFQKKGGLEVIDFEDYIELKMNKM